MVRSLPDHSLLDRLVRGRMWIPLLGILLAGIVFTQVEVLRLNAGMGRALRQATSLSVQNQSLRTSVAELSDDARIERLAARMGMVMPDPTSLSFVAGQPSLVRAIQNLHPPAPSQFLAQLPSGSGTGASTDSGSSATASPSSPGSSDATSSGTSASSDTSGSASAGGDTSGSGSASADTTGSSSSSSSDSSGASGSASSDSSGASGPGSGGASGSSSGG